MNELVKVMKKILDELIEINIKLDEISATVFESRDDVCFKVDSVVEALGEIKGNGIDNSISDACNMLEQINIDVSLIRDEI